MAEFIQGIKWVQSYSFYSAVLFSHFYKWCIVVLTKIHHTILLLTSYNIVLHYCSFCFDTYLTHFHTLLLLHNIFNFIFYYCYDYYSLCVQYFFSYTFLVHTYVLQYSAIFYIVLYSCFFDILNFFGKGYWFYCP